MAIESSSLTLLGTQSAAAGLAALSTASSPAAGQFTDQAASGMDDGTATDGYGTDTDGSTGGADAETAGGAPAGGSAAAAAATAARARARAADRASARAAARARADSAGTATRTPAVGADGADEDAVGDPQANFLSAMASARGRAPAADTPASSAPAARSTAKDADPTPDASTWVAQALMPARGATLSRTAAGSAGSAPAATSPAATADPGAANIAAAAAAAGAAQANLAGPQGVAGPAAAAIAAVDPTAVGVAPGSTAALANLQSVLAGIAADTVAGGAAADPAAGAAQHGVVATAGPADASAAQALAVLQSSVAAPAAPPAGAPTLSLHTPVGAPGWSQELGTQVTSLAQGGVTSASLQLSPAGMGPIEVHIGVQDGQASVWFGAAHPDTRSALEQSLPQLREMFANSGLPLTDAGVFREPPQQQHTPAAAGRAPQTDSAGTPGVTSVSNISLSLVDLYA